MITRTLALLTLPLAIACNGPVTKEPAVKEPFNIASLPADWVQLTKTDSGLIVYNSCNMGNTLLTISNNKNKPGLLLHGTQEDYDFDILESYTIKDTVIVKARWKDSKELQDFKFVWTDKAKQTGRWITTYSGGHVSDDVYVTSTNQRIFPKVDQPCHECWGDECDAIEKLQNIDAHPVDTIKKIFEDYIEYSESTDSPDDKKAMTRGLNALHVVTDPAALELLINVWMYYDPTDFPTRELVYKVLKQNKEAGIAAVKKRQAVKRESESEESAPYSELNYLLSELEKE